jgi:hypothetical protein
VPGGRRSGEGAAARPLAALDEQPVTPTLSEAAVQERLIWVLLAAVAAGRAPGGVTSGLGVVALAVGE